MLKPATKIQLSALCRCAGERFCFPAVGRRAVKQNWIKTHATYTGKTGSQERAFARVVVDMDDEPTELMMDCITGSIYPLKGGECLSSSQLQATGFKANVEQVTELLMAAGRDQNERMAA